jgi:putative copper resistance protein D
LLWFLRDYPLAAVLLRAATLAFDALLVGGIFFCAVLLPRGFLDRYGDVQFLPRALKVLRIAALGLAITQICFLSLDSAVLMSTSGLSLSNLYMANYFLAGALLIVTAGVLLFVTRWGLRPAWVLFIVPLLFATIWTSHSTSRLEDRIPFMILTGLHQFAAAIWIGGMPYLWLLLGSQCETAAGNRTVSDEIVRAVRRYSVTALVSVTVLVLAGFSMAWFYTQSWSAIYGTAYGIVLLAKSALLVGLLLLGVSNFLLIRKGHLHLPPALLRIARFSEVEIGIGFTIILVAASLTAQPPAVDLVQNRLTLPEIAARMTPCWPRFKTPPISAMPAVQPMGQAIRQYAMSPDDARSANNRIEQAWSEYNHHWAGIIVFAAGFFAVLAKWDRARWARNWPLVFLGLAVFLFFRADPEAWPLGPRGFWDSFYNPEDLQHRLFILLIVSFVAFEWSVQTHRLLSQRAALVFPAVCAVGGALLLTHSHSLGNVKEELLGEMSHTAIALCAVFAGGSRWLELHASGNNRGRTKILAAWIWPLCLMSIGLILLNYREA